MREPDLNVMPLVGSPAMHIAGRVGVLPGIVGRSRRARIDRVVPAIDPAIALETHDHGLAVGHGLIQIELQIRKTICVSGNVDPRVVEEVC